MLKPGGVLVLVVPRHERTFDHRRPITTMAHLIEDERRGTRENDLTHLPEILALHDLKQDAAAGDFASFKARSEWNVENRALHHHVFDECLVAEILESLEMQDAAIERVELYHIFAVSTTSRRRSSG